MFLLPSKPLSQDGKLRYQDLQEITTLNRTLEKLAQRVTMLEIKPTISQEKVAIRETDGILESNTPASQGAESEKEFKVVVGTPSRREREAPAGNLKQRNPLALSFSHEGNVALEMAPGFAPAKGSGTLPRRGYALAKPDTVRSRQDAAPTTQESKNCPWATALQDCKKHHILWSIFCVKQTAFPKFANDIGRYNKRLSYT